MQTGLATANYTFQKIDKSAVDSVKAAIFQRATSKSSGALDTLSQVSSKNEYNTTSLQTKVQNDLMSEARQSTQKILNPFSESMFKSQATQAASSTNVSESQTVEKRNRPAQAEKNSQRLVMKSMALQTGMMSSSMRESVMLEAKEQMSSNNTLMSRLQFINTQNAISAYPSAKFA